MRVITKPSHSGRSFHRSHHLFHHVFSQERATLYVFALMILFWTLFDATMTYLTPIILSEKGFSTTLIGLIISTSSITGALFDFILCKVFKNSTFKRVFLVMFIICSIYPMVLWHVNAIWLYIFVMGLWGVYFDMYGFGLFDFIGRATNPKDHSDGFGLIQIFRSLGLLVAPIIAGYFISESINFSSLKVGWIFLGIGFIFFIILSLLTKNMVDKFIEHEGPKLRPKKNALFEAKLLVKLSNELRSPLIITFFLFLVEAFFWTLAPLFAQSQTMKDFGGIFLAAYSLPPLIIGWFVGRITSKFGKKKTAIIGIMLGSIFIFSILYITNPIVIIAAAFIGSCFFGIALPSINGAYADYISEASYVEGEIEALEDFSFNLGYIIGPISAGIISDLLGMTSAFAVLGLLGFVTALVLLKITPKSIDIKI